MGYNMEIETAGRERGRLRAGRASTSAPSNGSSSVMRGGAACNRDLTASSPLGTRYPDGILQRHDTIRSQGARSVG